MLVDPVPVPSGRIALPQFDQRVGHGTAIVVEHASADSDALAQRLAFMLARQIVVRFADIVVAEDRARSLLKAFAAGQSAAFAAREESSNDTADTNTAAANSVDTAGRA